MNDLIVWRDKLQELYAMKSIYIDKAVQFVLALVTFLMINQNIGLMKAVATPVVAVALAVICTFLPPVVTAYVAAGLVIVHLFKLSIGVAAAAALIFVVMFIFYCRFTPKKALLLLVTPVAFMLHVPYVVPVACALVLGPISAVPVVFGTIIYYMIECVRTSATAITSADGITRQISLFVKTVFQDKTLWITVTYHLGGVDVSTMDDDQQAEIRNKMLGFIFQQYNLIPKLTVLENVELPLLYAGVGAEERKERAVAALGRVGLADKQKNLPSQLSGGQQQRVSIARALAGNPSVILADEPTGALDSRTGREVLGFLQKLNQEGDTVVLITHDNSIAVKAKRIVRLQDGRIIYDGDASDPAAVVQPEETGADGEVGV